MLKQIFNDSLQNLKKNWLMSIMLCLIAILSSALFFALMFIPFFGEFLTIFIIVPFILVPIIFAMQMFHFGLREGYQPSGKGFFTYFKAYFRPGIMGVYRIINTILFAMLAEMGVSFIVGGILIAVVQSNPQFMSVIDQLAAALSANDTNTIAHLMESEQIRLLAFASYVPGFGVSAMVAFLSASFNSMSIYFKVKNPTINPAYSQRMYIFAKNQIKGKLIKEYWGLNWPIFVLFAIGYGIGVAVAYYNPELNYTVGMFLGLGIGLAMSLLYAPFFVSNLEQIYLSHQAHFAQSPNLYAAKMQESLNAQMDMMQQQMQDLARQQDQMRQRQNNNDTQSSDQNNNSNNEVKPEDENKNTIDTADSNNVVDAEVKEKDDDK